MAYCAYFSSCIKANANCRQLSRVGVGDSAVCIGLYSAITPLYTRLRVKLETIKIHSVRELRRWPNVSSGVRRSTGRVAVIGCCVMVTWCVTSPRRRLFPLCDDKSLFRSVDMVYSDSAAVSRLLLTPAAKKMRALPHGYVLRIAIPKVPVGGGRLDDFGALWFFPTISSVIRPGT